MGLPGLWFFPSPKSAYFTSIPKEAFLHFAPGIEISQRWSEGKRAPTNHPEAICVNGVDKDLLSRGLLKKNLPPQWPRLS
jgi:hypothetical protein